MDKELSFHKLGSFVFYRETEAVSVRIDEFILIKVPSYIAWHWIVCFSLSNMLIDTSVRGTDTLLFDGSICGNLNYRSTK